MARNKKNFTTEMRAAKIAGRFGWNSMTDDEANKKATEPVPWRRHDSGNLARIAVALERIAARLAEVSKTADSLNRSVSESVSAKMIHADTQ